MGNPAATQGNGVRADDPLVRRIFIVGAGGFGREVALWIRDALPEAADRIVGFLSANPRALDGHSSALPILGDPEEFQPADDSGFVLAIGIPGARRRVAELLLSRGARFLSIVHPTAIIAPTARLGEGSIICPYAIVSDAASVGRFNLMNYHSSLAHDAATGDFAVLSPYAALGGSAAIGNDTFLGLHASVAPGKKIGPRSKVSANSCASHDTPPDALIYGVPGKIGHKLDLGDVDSGSAAPQSSGLLFRRWPPATSR
jgi:sugar O-acyltransferase (sialic acid O-acetyltransferase NeuD family)